MNSPRCKQCLCGLLQAAGCRLRAADCGRRTAGSLGTCVRHLPPNVGARVQQRGVKENSEQHPTALPTAPCPLCTRPSFPVPQHRSQAIHHSSIRFFTPPLGSLDIQSLISLPDPVSNLPLHSSSQDNSKRVACLPPLLCRPHHG